MTRLSRLSPQDVERLSVYLDGRLSEAEASRLEERVAREPSLRQALEDLRWTAGLLRAMPQVAVPRSFALRPEAVARPKARRWYPVLQLGTALAGLAFVAVVGLDVLAARVASAPQRALEAQDALAEAPAEVGAELFAAQVALTPTPLAAGAAESEYRRDATGTPELLTLPAAAPSLSPTAEKLIPPGAGQPAGEEGYADQVGPTAAPPGPSPFRMVEIGLAGLALVLGVLTLRVRRRGAG